MSIFLFFITGFNADVARYKGKNAGMLMVNFLFRKIFRRNLNEGNSLAEINFVLKVKSVSTGEITSFRFPSIIFLMRKLNFTYLPMKNRQRSLKVLDSNLIVGKKGPFITTSESKVAKAFMNAL